MLAYTISMILFGLGAAFAAISGVTLDQNGQFWLKRVTIRGWVTVLAVVCSVISGISIYIHAKQQEDGLYLLVQDLTEQLNKQESRNNQLVNVLSEMQHEQQSQLDEPISEQEPPAPEPAPTLSVNLPELDDVFGQRNFREVFLNSTNTTAANTRYKAISADKLNVRAKPSTQSQVLGQLKQGTYVRILNAQPDWMLVETAGGTTGWVSSQFVGDIK
ncbi:SH3 domain-containing protein [Parasalinivibrio latis]|uniref:SH3 domain-containing protein n=1 Tax=Parasalinivibrio latis TaxID=2952610 RepID=UPI0030DE544C